MDFSFLTSYWFIGLMLVIGLTSLGGSLLRKIPIVRKLPKKLFLWVGVLALAMVLFPSLMVFSGTASLGSDGVVIERIQTTTAYVMRNDSTGQTVADSGVDDTKMSDFYATEGFMNSDARIDTGVFLVTRSGALPPASCEVRVIKPPRYDISDTTYHIVNEDDTTGIMEARVYTGSSTSGADMTHPKETNMLAFDEGVASGYVSFNISIDETGFDPLTQYDYKDVRVDLCGYPYVYRIHKNDA